MEASSLIMTKGESPDESYHPLSPLQFWKKNDLRTRGIVLTAWVLTLVVSIGLGIASISLKWSGLPMHFGGMDVSVTIYPTLIFCMLWVVWFGFWWGFIPAYLSTLVLALYSGMPIGWAVVFAFSDPIGLAIFAVVYRALPVSLNLRSLNSLALFVFMSFVSGMFGSSGAFIWCLAQGSLSALLPIWQGWWLGAFLQNIVLVAPVVHLGTRRVMRWRNDHGLLGQHTTQTQRQILLMTIVALTGVLLYLYVAIRLVSKQIESALHGSDPISLRNAASLQVESMNEIFWVISIIIAFIAFFGYQLFVLWVERKQAEYELTLQNSGLEVITTALEKSLAERKKTEEAIRLQAVELEQEVAERRMAQESLQEKAILLEEEIEKRQQVLGELEKLNDELEQRVMLAELSAKIGCNLTASGDLQNMLKQCSESLVRYLNVAFARIWTLNDAENILELQASAGMYTRIDGIHSRVPVGKFKIGLIAEERKPHITNAVLGDTRVHDQEWAKREGMVAFAGHPLVIGDKLVGVMAMFSRNQLSDVSLTALESVSNEIAIGIERKRNEEALEQLNEELEQRVKQRTAELDVKNRELERFNKLFINRELKMVELKERISQLEK